MNAKTKEILTLLNGTSFAEARQIIVDTLDVLDYSATVNFVSEDESRRAYDAVRKSTPEELQSIRRVNHPLNIHTV
ncbi:MAG TPA: hypothetical protein PLK28_17595 [Candidatus Rifleibacterium sp.]|nr:hypothetical protein [Candidatus Rifleibacterium sp.]